MQDFGLQGSYEQIQSIPKVNQVMVALNRDYSGDPKNGALKSRGLINQGSNFLDL